MKKRKILITCLLISTIFFSIVLAVIIEPSYVSTITDLSELNNHIDLAIEHAGLELSIFEKTTVKVTNEFSRTIYTTRLPSSFSKTSFHLALHQYLYQLNIQCPAKVILPENNMNIHIVYKNTIFRTIKLNTAKAQIDYEQQ